MLMRTHGQTAGCQPDRPAAAGQPRPDDDRGARRSPRRYPVAAHQQLRRGARAADRRRGPDRPADPAGDRPRDRCDEHRRPARRLLLHREADRRDGGGRLRLLRPHRRARRHGRARSRRTSPSARSPTPPSPIRPRSRAASGSWSASTPFRSPMKMRPNLHRPDPGRRGAAEGTARANDVRDATSPPSTRPSRR